MNNELLGNLINEIIDRQKEIKYQLLALFVEIINEENSQVILSFYLFEKMLRQQEYIKIHY